MAKINPPPNNQERIDALTKSPSPAINFFMLIKLPHHSKISLLRQANHFNCKGFFIIYGPSVQPLSENLLYCSSFLKGIIEIIFAPQCNQSVFLFYHHAFRRHHRKQVQAHHLLSSSPVLILQL